MSKAMEEWAKPEVKKIGIKKVNSYTKASCKKTFSEIKKESKYKSTKILTNFVPRIGPKKSFCKPSLFILNPNEASLKKYSDDPVNKNLKIVSSSESEESEDNSSNLSSEENKKINDEDKNIKNIKNNNEIIKENPDEDKIDFKSDFNLELKSNVEVNNEINNSCTNNINNNNNEENNNNNNYLSILDVLSMTKK